MDVPLVQQDSEAMDASVSSGSCPCRLRWRRYCTWENALRLFVFLGAFATAILTSYFSMRSQVSTLSAQVEVLNTKVPLLETKVTNMEESVRCAQKLLQNVTTNLADIEKKVANLSVSNIESELALVTSRVSALSTQAALVKHVIQQAEANCSTAAEQAVDTMRRAAQVSEANCMANCSVVTGQAVDTVRRTAQVAEANCSVVAEQASQLTNEVQKAVQRLGRVEAEEGALAANITNGVVHAVGKNLSALQAQLQQTSDYVLYQMEVNNVRSGDPVFHTTWPLAAQPEGIAVNGTGEDFEVYVTTSAGNVSVFDNAGAQLRSWVVPNGSESVQGCIGVAIQEAEVFVSCYQVSTVTVFSREGALLRTMGGYGTGYGQFRNPFGIAVSGHELYVTDSGNNVVQVLNSTNGSLIFQWPVRNPLAIAFGPDLAEVYVGTLSGNVRVFTRSGVPRRQWAATYVDAPRGLLVAGDHVYFGSQNSIQVFTRAGQLLWTWESSGTPAFNYVFGIAIAEQQLYIADGDKRVVVLNNSVCAAPPPTCSVGGLV